MMTAEDLAPMNKLEMTSIKALLAYAAHDRKVSEDIIRQNVAVHFGVEDVTLLPSRAYEDVIRFLVDTQIDIVMN